MAKSKIKIFSHRDVNLYFEGYEKQEVLDPKTGKRKTEYRYTGDYYLYRVPEGSFRKHKLLCVLLTLGATLSFLASGLLGSQASVTLYVGIPALFSLIPLCYLLLGLWGLVRHGSEKMTIRDYAFGIGRMKNSLWAVGLLWGISVLGHIFYMVRHLYVTGWELLCLSLELLALVLLFFQWKRQEEMETHCIRKAKSQYDKNLDGSDEERGRNGE